MVTTPKGLNGSPLFGRIFNPEFDIYFKNGPLEVLKTLKSYFHFQKM
jgi:hypothetical protein